MLFFGLFAILMILIVLEKTKKINLSNMGASVFMIVAVTAVTGLYLLESVRTFVALLLNVMNVDSKTMKNLHINATTMSNARIIIEFVLMLIIFIPCVVGIIYILTNLIKKPVIKSDDDTDTSYSLKCSVRTSTLTVISSGMFIILIALMIVLSMPYLDKFVTSLGMFNPLVIIFLMLFTGGIAFFYIGGMFTAMNAQLLTIVGCFGLASLVCGFIAFVLGIASIVRARKNGAISNSSTFWYVLCMFMTGFNIVPALVLRYTLKKKSSEI